MEYKQNFEQDISFINEILLDLDEGHYGDVEDKLKDWRDELVQLRNKDNDDKVELANLLDKILNEES